MASVSKNADIERRLTIYYLQNAVICTKAPSNKRGAGGARAARRIRIRRPRLLAAGLEACWIFSADFCRFLKLLPTPPCPPTPAPGTPFHDPQTPNYRFLADFLQIENSSKI